MLLATLLHPSAAGVLIFYSVLGRDKSTSCSARLPACLRICLLAVMPVPPLTPCLFACFLRRYDGREVGLSLLATSYLLILNYCFFFAVLRASAVAGVCAPSGGIPFHLDLYGQDCFRVTPDWLSEMN